jgi:acetyl esterase/lipase
MSMDHGLSRREALRGALAAAAGLRLGAAVQPKARSVIQIWMWGGPAHLDTFDPKPGAGNDYCGPFTNPIATNVDGIRIGELLPLLAKQADKYSILRGMTHGVNAHETASYMVQTGRPGGGRDVYPSVGAVVSLLKGQNAGYKGLIPPYVVLTEPQGRFSEAGFLGGRFKPFATGGDPAQVRFAVEGVVVPGISDQRQRNRRDYLGKLDTFGQAMKGDLQLASFEQAESQAYDLILGNAGKVFDLSQEKDDLRERYGRNTFGQSCLAARRLVERGVPYVTINYRGWDTHSQHFQTMRRKLPEMDKGMSALLQDLSDSGLLATTIVWWSGEFGRTPRVQWEAPWNGGRNHYGKVFSAVVAGGGFKGGQVVGASDARGEEVRDRPVYPVDLIAGMYELLGIDAAGKLPHPMGQDARVTPTAADGITMGGRLKEIL